MVNIVIPDELAEQLEIVARRENRPVAKVIETMLEQYETHIQSEAEEPHPLDAFIGIYDDDITDMSTTVRETIQEHFQRKNERSD